MKRILLVLAIAAVAQADVLSQRAVDVLTAIDVVPTEPQLTSAFGDQDKALTQLAFIATNSDGNQDPGIRLRAIQGIPKYCDTPARCTQAHVALASLIPTSEFPHAGTDVLIVRAAIEAIGPLRVTGDVVPLEKALQLGPRDIRAAAAHALRDLCNSSAIGPLHTAYTSETVEQVRIAISEALRDLPCP